MSEEAVDIYQAYLDASTRLVIGGDAEAYCDYVQLPFVFRTSAGIEVIETAADLCTDILRAHDWLHQQDVTDYHRIARTARFLDDDTIEGFHVTYALRGAFPAVEPYASRAILRRTNEGWKVSFAEHELADALYPGRNATARHGLFADTWSVTRDTPYQDQNRALDIYRGVIAEIAETATRGDYDAFVANYAMPYHAHMDTGDYLVESVQDARKFEVLLREKMDEVDAHELVLTADTAMFMCANRILGYHEARLMNGGECRFGPIRSRLILTRDGDRWLVKSVSNALSTSDLNAGELVVSPNLPTIREITKRMKT